MLRGPIYKPNEKEIARATALLIEAFGGTMGFPETEGRMRLIAKGLCGIVWFLPMSEIMKIVWPNRPDKWAAHPDLGDVPDHEWLMERAVATFDRFPALIQLRRIHGEFFRPRDGQEWETLLPL